MKKMSIMFMSLICFLLMACNNMNNNVNINDDSNNQVLDDDTEPIDTEITNEKTVTEEISDDASSTLIDKIKAKCLNYLSENYKYNGDISTIAIKDAFSVTDEIIMIYIDSSMLDSTVGNISELIDKESSDNLIPFIYKSENIYELDDIEENDNFTMDEINFLCMITQKYIDEKMNFINKISINDLFPNMVFAIYKYDYYVECSPKECYSSAFGSTLTIIEKDDFGNPTRAYNYLLDEENIYVRIYEDGEYRWVLEK